MNFLEKAEFSGLGGRGKFTKVREQATRIEVAVLPNVVETRVFGRYWSSPNSSDIILFKNTVNVLEDNLVDVVFPEGLSERVGCEDTVWDIGNRLSRNFLSAIEIWSSLKSEVDIKTGVDIKVNGEVIKEPEQLKQTLLEKGFVPSELVY